MNEIITRLSLTHGQYEAELSFPAFFGKINYTIKGSIDLSGDPPLSKINEIILDAAYEDAKKMPAVHRILPPRAELTGLNNDATGDSQKRWLEQRMSELRASIARHGVQSTGRVFKHWSDE